MKEKSIAFEGNEVCMTLHTALRKCCDSPITSVAYNLVHLMNKAWRRYGALIAARLNKGVDPEKAARSAFQELKDMARRDEKWLEEEGEEAARAAFCCTLRMFNDNDWAAMVSYLVEDAASRDKEKA